MEDLTAVSLFHENSFETRVVDANEAAVVVAPFGKICWTALLLHLGYAHSMGNFERGKDCVRLRQGHCHYKRGAGTSVQNVQKCAVYKDMTRLSHKLFNV